MKAWTGRKTEWVPTKGRGEEEEGFQERFWEIVKKREPKKQRGTFAEFEEAMESSAWSQTILSQRESFRYSRCTLCTLPFLYHSVLFLWLCLGFFARCLQPCLFIYSSNYLYLKSILDFSGVHEYVCQRLMMSEWLLGGFGIPVCYLRLHFLK